MGVFDDLVRQQQQTDKPGQLTPQDQARQAQQQGGGWVPPPGYLAGNTSAGAADPLQRNVLDRIGQATGQYLPDNAAGGSAANPNSIFTQKELRKSDTAKNYATTGVLNQTTADMKTKAINEEQDRLETRAINTGLRDAVTSGGYTGGIEFLKTVDPKQAMQFEAAKLTLDKSIMENDTYKMAHTNDKLKVMAEGYGILGNMGMAILQAKPEERAAMYQNILPMVKQVNPNASNTLDADAIAMFGLAQFQATDANKIAAGPATLNTANLAISKIDNRISQLIKTGADENNVELKDLLLQRQGHNAQATQAIDQANLTKWNLEHKKVTEAKDAISAQQGLMQLKSSVQSQYDKESKEFITKKTNLSDFYASLDAYKADPTNPAAQKGLVRTMAMNLNKGALGVVDVSDLANLGSGASTLLKKMESFISSNGQVVLTPQEVGNLVKLADSIQTRNTTAQFRVDKHYQEEVVPNLPDLAKVGGINYLAAAPKPAIEFLKANPSPQMIEAFKQKYHYDPTVYLQQNTPVADPEGRQ